MDEDRSPAYNNAACRMMAIGNERVALDLFRGALESKLAHERALGRRMMLAERSTNHESGAMHMDEGDDEQELPEMEAEQPPQRCVTPEIPDCLQVADEHLARIDEYIQAASTNAIDTPMRTTVMVSQESAGDIHLLQVQGYDDYHHHDQPSASSSSRNDTTVVPLESRGYNPYLCLTPFLIPPNNDTVHNQYISALIVFNLGVVHQWFSRYSPKTAAFYEISAALLSNVAESTSESLRLRVCLLNNFAVWCFENADGEAMRTSLEHLSYMLDEPAISQVLSTEMILGFRTNIQCLLTPRDGGSPAA